MVIYNLDIPARRNCYYYLVIISTLIGFLISKVSLIDKYSLTAPSTMAIFGFLYWLFDNHLWKWRFLNNLNFLGLYHIPNLNGTWSGKISRGKESKEISISINQKWSKIELCLEANDTISYTTMASIQIEDEKIVKLKWLYFVKPRTGLEADNLYGEGVTDLVLKKINDELVLSGFYYSTKLRKGKIEVVRKSTLHNTWYS